MEIRNIQDFLPDVKDYYYIRDDGLVWNARTQQEVKQKYKKGTTYLGVELRLLNGPPKWFRVHRLVMMAFSPIDNPDKFEVHHIDGNKDNNRIDNLEWRTNIQVQNFND